MDSYVFSDESAEQFSSRKGAERLESYVSKPLHGYFLMCVLCSPSNYGQGFLISLVKVW